MKLVTLGALGVALGATLACLPACSAIVGITDLPSEDGGASSSNEGGTTTPGDGGSAGGIAAFLGTWTITTGTTSLTCGGTPTNNPDSGSVTIARGTTSDLVSEGTCPFRLNLTSPQTATLVTGQSCQYSNDEDDTVTIFPEGSFTLAATGATGTLTFTGTATLVAPSGASETCEFAESDQYAKN